jgi:hypothetical protein
MLDKEKVAEAIKRSVPTSVVQFALWLLGKWWAWMIAFPLIAEFVTAWKDTPLEFKLMLGMVAAGFGLHFWSSLFRVNGGINSLPAGKTSPAHLVEVEWRGNLEYSSIDRPWRLDAKLNFLQTAKDVGGYIRSGRLIHYIGSPSAWNWSPQTTFIESQTCHSGRQFTVPIMEIQPKSGEMTLLGTKVGFAKHERHADWYCIELVVASDGAFQRERRYYAMVYSEHLIPVPIDSKSLEIIEDDKA